jgi:GAF domain-containing protein
VADTKAVEYTAGDLKFLTAIASQVAPAIDHAILHERTVREARERELALQQQLAAMRIDINQSTISRQVSTITGTEYFKRLREQAEDLRRDLDV